MNMKKIILSLAVTAFALASAMADNTTKATADSKASCCEGKACCSAGANGKSACTKGMPSKTALMSPKAAATAGIHTVNGAQPSEGHVVGNG